MSDIKHGTHRSYKKLNCRCTICVKFASEYTASIRNRRQAERKLIDGRLIHPNAPHGTSDAYGNWGCHCEECTNAHAKKLANYRKARSA